VADEFLPEFHTGTKACKANELPGPYTELFESANRVSKVLLESLGVSDYDAIDAESNATNDRAKAAIAAIRDRHAEFLAQCVDRDEADDDLLLHGLLRPSSRPQLDRRSAMEALVVLYALDLQDTQPLYVTTCCAPGSLADFLGKTYRHVSWAA
jgi:hypothetical protein